MAEVYLDPASVGTVPDGENVFATISLVDPEGILIDSVETRFTGFTNATDGRLTRGYGGAATTGVTLFKFLGRKVQSGRMQALLGKSFLMLVL